MLMVARENLGAVAQISRDRGWKKLVHVRFGGARRQDSVRLGLKALPECDWVVVHDGARPLATVKAVRDGLAAAAPTGAAISAVPAQDTVKVVTDDGKVVRTLDRRTVALVQTPQVFRRDLLERAHNEIAEDVTDDAAMMERLGITVAVYMGDYGNIKVTTPHDLALAEALLDAQSKEGQEAAS